MAVKELIIDPATLDLERIIAPLEDIRRYNPQRFEMEQLSAICYEDAQTNICVGYKDLTENEFWVRGHMPGMPLMPGVLLCEAAAQMASYYSQKHNLLGSSMVGFGGLDEVRFRGVVRPGDRLVIAAQLVKVRRHAMIVARFQCFVDNNLVCEGMIRGIPLSEELIIAARNVTGPTKTE